MAFDPHKKAKADARLYWIRCRRHKNDQVKHDADGCLYMEMKKEARDEVVKIAVDYIFGNDCKNKRRVVK